MWARAILPRQLAGDDYPHNDVDLHQGTPLHHIAANRHVAIYTDGAGFHHQAHKINQRAGSGAFITALNEQGEWDPSFSALCLRSVDGHQTVPRAELTMPIHLLPKLSNALSILIITDNEPFYLNASDHNRLTKALRGDNADLWQQWVNTTSNCPVGITIGHIRSHALDDDTDKANELLTQNIQRRRYLTPAQRKPEHRELDETVYQRHVRQHNGLRHSLGNAYADKAATIAQDRSLPCKIIAAEYEKLTAYTGCIAKRIAIIEAHCRRTDVRLQSKLAEVPPAPEFHDTLTDTLGSLESSGHAIYAQGKWLRCRNCPIKSHSNAARTFLDRPCIAGQPLHELVPPKSNPHRDSRDTTDLPTHTATPTPVSTHHETIRTTTPLPPQKQTKQCTPQHCDICHVNDVSARCPKCERFVCDNLNCNIDDTNHCGTCRYHCTLQTHGDANTDTDHSKGIDTAFSRFYAKRQRQATHHPPCHNLPDHTTKNNATANGTSVGETTTLPLTPVAPWDDPDAPVDLPPDDEDLAGEPHPDEPAEAHPRRQPTAIRARIIRHNREARAARKSKIKHDRDRAVRLLATPSPVAAVTAPAQGIGKGHRTYINGPILFCRVCGATKTHSQGKRLAQQCRGWAPPGTRATIRARLRGRNYAFYSGLTSHSSAVIPVGGGHLPHAPAPAAPPAPAPPPAAPVIRLTRFSVVNAHLPRTHHVQPEDPSDPTASSGDSFDPLLP